YDHYTNRNGEANYHTHAVISPLSFHTNGIVVVLNQQSVLAAKEFINMYHSQILRDITRRDMGLQWEQRQSVFNPYISVWEIKQIPDKLIRATSSANSPWDC
ncbi:relaxase domain-containing protein, partial [Gardnerella vaginalis]